MAPDAEKKVHVYNERLWSSVIAPFAAELERLHPIAYRKATSGGEGMLVMFGKHDIRVDGKTFWMALTEAEHKLENAPPMQVKVGEWVCIGGRWFQVSGVNSSTRKIRIERIDRDGSVLGEGAVISSDWCYVDLPSGDQLKSVPVAGPDTNPWEAIPDHFRDGLARARFVGRILTAHLIRCGVADDD